MKHSFFLLLLSTLLLLEASERDADTRFLRIRLWNTMPEELLRLTSHRQDRTMGTSNIQTLYPRNHIAITICILSFEVLRPDLELAFIAQGDNDNVRIFLHTIFTITVLRCIILSILIPVNHNLIINLLSITIHPIQKRQKGIWQWIADGKIIMAGKHVAEMC